jgi:hypothetical protein
MKLKAFALTAGLLAFGVTNAAWADLPQCKTNLDGQVRETGSKCTSKSYKFNMDSRCTCPGDKPAATKKCHALVVPPNAPLTAGKRSVYSCEVP